MKEVIYLDVYFLTNFIMDLVSLLVASQLCSERIKWNRALLASLFGGAVSLLPILFSWRNALTLTVGGLLFLPMVFIAFGKRSVKRFWFLCLFSFLTSLFLGGAVEFLSFYTGNLKGESRITLTVFLAVLCFSFGAWSLWGKNLRRRMETSVVELSVSYRKKTLDLIGLVDSASFLREPMSGMPVILLKAGFSSSLLSPALFAALKEGTLGEKERIFPVPLKTASGRGVLYAFQPESVRFYHKRYPKKVKEIRQVLIALDFSEGGFAGCPCLIPLSIL